MNSAFRAPLSALLGLLLAVCAAVGGTWSAPLVALVSACAVALFAVGWGRLLEIPSSLGSGLVIALVGFASVAVALAVPAQDAFDVMAYVLAIGVFLSFLHQMLRRDRSHLAVSLTSTVFGVLLAGTAGGAVAAAGTGHNPHLLIAAAVAFVACSFVLALPIRAAVLAPTAVVVAIIVLVAIEVATGGAVPGATREFGVTAGLGLLIGIVTVTMAYLLGRLDRAGETLPMLSAAACPVLATGVLVYLALLAA